MGAEHIVVGVDGSAASRQALAWAVEHARRVGATVEAVHAWSVPELGADPVTRALGGSADLEDQARRELQLVVDDVDAADLAAPVERTLVAGDAVRALADATCGADLLVVGTRGLEASADAPIGPVTAGVVRAARCPVVVVPAPCA